MSKIITLVKKKRRKCDARSLNVLRKMTEAMESGELRCVAVIGVRKDGGYTRGWSEVNTTDVLALVGAIESTKAELVKSEFLND